MNNKLEKLKKELLGQIWVNRLLDQGDVFLVGGVVRDAFLNKPNKDIDLVVEDLTFGEIADILKPFGKVDLHGESFAVLVFKPFGHVGEPFEIAIPRIDRKIGTGHNGFEVVTKDVTLLDDLKRRDFTINSIAFGLATGKLIDPFNGLKDIEAGILRATDETAFTEDPLRILRGIQFASRFGFQIEDKTFSMMKTNSLLIREIVGERIFDELIKITSKNGDTEIALDLIHKTGTGLALFGHPMDPPGGLKGLDEISFFWSLGILGGVNPSEFIRTKLKGDKDLIKNVRGLDLVIEELSRDTEESDLRLFLAKTFDKAPRAKDSVILPADVKRILALMKNGLIPSTFKDVAIDGNDIIKITGANGPDVGLWQELLFVDALMDRFNWINHDDCIRTLKKLMG